MRTPQQTEIGLFWTEHTGKQYARAFRTLATQKGLDTSDTARLMAMLWAGYADAGIGGWNAKLFFSFWRPVTAIRAGGGNPALTGDPSWLPLANTPNHPEYPAAHGFVTGVVSTILAGYFGTPNVTFSVDSLVTHTTHYFTSTTDLMLRFHRELESHNEPGQRSVTNAGALQQAALSVMRRPEYRHPFYWAGFVLIGDGR